MMPGKGILALGLAAALLVSAVAAPLSAQRPGDGPVKKKQFKAKNKKANCYNICMSKKGNIKGCNNFCR